MRITQAKVMFTAIITCNPTTFHRTTRTITAMPNTVPAALTTHHHTTTTPPLAQVVPLTFNHTPLTQNRSHQVATTFHLTTLTAPTAQVVPIMLHLTTILRMARIVCMILATTMLTIIAMCIQITMYHTITIQMV
jgi:hypothetical protein